MAFTNQEVAAWLGSNPGLSDAQIAAAMEQFNVSPAQVSAVTGVPEGQVVARVANTLSPGETVNLGGTIVQPVYSSTGDGENFQQGPLSQVLVYKAGQGTGDAYAKYSPTGQQEGTGQFQKVGGLSQMLKETGRELGPLALAALTAGGAGGFLGNAIGLTGTAANAVGGALLGGGGAALTGGDVLKGALLGGAGGYLSGAGVDPMQAAMDADIAGGMVPEFGTNAAYDAFMQSAMTPAAQAAIEQQIANSSVAGFTPDEIQAQGNLITDLASGNAMGPQTADQMGQGFQNYMADAGYSPVTTTASTPSTSTTTTPTKTQTGGLKSASDTILGMDKDTLKLVTTGASLLPGAASVLGIGNSTTAAPTAAAAPVDSRRLAQWDWDRIAADAAAANLGVNSFVSRNWNKFNQGEYNKPGAYFSSAPTPTPVTASTPATEPTQQTQGYSRGGNVGSGNSPLRQISYLAKGGGSGRDDTIPARLSDGEYVMDAETVSLLGDGSTNEGANRLDQMRAKIRQHKGKSMARGKFSANAKSPLAYLKESS